jgi:hypothetical protein
MARLTDPHPAGSHFVAELIDEHGRFRDLEAPGRPSGIDEREAS